MTNTIDQWLKQQEIISHSYGDQKSKFKVPAGLGSGESSFLGLPLSCCGLSSEHASGETREEASFLISLLIRALVSS